MSHSHPSPSIGDGNENLGPLFHESRLLLRLQHQVSVALLFRGERRKNPACNPEVGLTHVRALGEMWSIIFHQLCSDENNMAKRLKRKFSGTILDVGGKIIRQDSWGWPS